MMKFRIRLLRALRRCFALAFCMLFALCCAPLQALIGGRVLTSAEEGDAETATAYLSYTDTSWGVQLDGAGAGGEGN